MAFDPLTTLRVLNRYSVRFVVIGGVAANILGSPSITNDLDVCYDRGKDNLEVLAAALAAIGVTLRGAPSGLGFTIDAVTLGNGDSFTFDTQAGPFDIIGTPAGTSGYADLIANATLMQLDDDVRVWVCALDDLIRMKAASGRPKDRIELEVLGALRDEVEGWPEE